MSGVPDPEVFRAFLDGSRPTYGAVLLIGLTRRYGLELLDWDGLTIELEVKRDFGVEMPRLVYDQLMGLISAITGDAVYREAEPFDQLVNALNRASVQHEQDAPTTSELAWTITELGLVDPEPHGRPEQPFNHQVAAYCRTCMEEDGYQVAPKVLKFAQMRNRTIGADDPMMFAGAFESHQRAAEEVDAEMKTKLAELLDHLEELGIELPTGR